jgi:hypothetical protein
MAKKSQIFKKKVSENLTNITQTLRLIFLTPSKLKTTSEWVTKQRFDQILWSKAYSIMIKIEFREKNEEKTRPFWLRFG